VCLYLYSSGVRLKLQKSLWIFFFIWVVCMASDFFVWVVCMVSDVNWLVPKRLVCEGAFEESNI